MPQLPHQLRCLDRIRRLLFSEPLYHSFRVPRGGCRGGVRGGGRFDEEVAEDGERGGCFDG